MPAAIFQLHLHDVLRALGSLKAKAMLESSQVWLYTSCLRPGTLKPPQESKLRNIKGRRQLYHAANVYITCRRNKLKIVLRSRNRHNDRRLTHQETCHLTTSGQRKLAPEKRSLNAFCCNGPCLYRRSHKAAS